MERDEEADNMVEVEYIANDVEDEQACKRRKITTHRDEEFERVKALHDTIQQQVNEELRGFIARTLEKNKLVLQQVERQVKEQEAQMRDKYYFVPRCYDEQIRSGPRSRVLDLTRAQLEPIMLPPHPSTPKTTAHVTIAHNVAPKGFDDRSRPRHYAPYFEDGESEADAGTLARYYYAPPPHFRALHSELTVYRLLIRLEDQLPPSGDEGELISPVNLALVSRVTRVPQAIIKHYFGEHRGYLAWKTQRAQEHKPFMGSEEFYEVYCRRCCTFDCPLHRSNSKWTPVHIARRTAELTAVTLHPTPCSDTCHLKVPSKEYCGTLPEIKVELLRRAIVVFAKHYCRIRKCIAPSLTCAEIRDYVVTHLNDVKSLPKLAAPLPKQYKIITRDRINDKELAAYEPCSHDGPCAKSPLCACHANNLHCEKYCACAESCSNRFKGCRCTSRVLHRPLTCICIETRCICAQNRRECDLDLCQCSPHTCKQRDLQTKKPKHLWIGASAVAGFGLFAVNKIKSGEFIGEYVGEVIPTNEAERRGLIADKIKRSYLFDTGGDLCVDSTKFGNRLKFANHSATPNCQPKQLRVNGELRLAFYATEDIEPNEELFINYDYSDPHSKGITNERPIDVLVNKRQLSSEHVMYDALPTGEISHVIHERADSDASHEMNSSENEIEEDAEESKADV